jgi:putative phage-type endonuclease
MLTVSAPQGERIVISPDSPAWTKARIGCLTASRMADVLAVSKRDGKPLKARQDYMMELVAERMTDIACSHYVTSAMEWGLAYEQEAKDVYQEVSGNLIAPTGFIMHPTIEFCGATPDASVDPDGLLEIKCPTTTTHIQWILDGEVPEQHRPQMLLQLAVTGREFCDFMSYDPRVPARKKAFLRRFVPEKSEIERIEDEARKFLAEVDALFDRVNA